ncbi:transmembrane protein C1orf162 homolog [Saccopteryx bilineata]|uniref:transmembrane protein C1orf162 homolog n=1 Tax=Saccopteryx bilineata TaxID=59482 RepID=UPI00338E47AF
MKQAQDHFQSVASHKGTSYKVNEFTPCGCAGRDFILQEVPSLFSREDNMGGNQSKTDLDTDRLQTTKTPRLTCPPCLSNSPNKELHLVLAFFAGILLTLLLMALVLLIVKCYRKGHSNHQALDPHSDSLAKLSSSREKQPTSACMAFSISAEKTDHSIANRSAASDSIVYAQINVPNSPSVANKA